jgi:hypothetical protein
MASNSIGFVGLAATELVLVLVPVVVLPAPRSFERLGADLLALTSDEAPVHRSDGGMPTCSPALEVT